MTEIKIDDRRLQVVRRFWPAVGAPASCHDLEIAEIVRVQHAEVERRPFAD